jgi:hypothetical protein
MQLLTLLTTAAALLLAPTALAAPVESASADSSKEPQMAAAANYGQPQCKTAMMNDLCLSDNADAYCDVTGFHNEFMKSCAGNCYCV